MTEIAIDLIRTDGGTQPRAELNDDTVQDYAQQMLEGAAFPAVVLFYDGADYWLADGFHRYHAAQQACRVTINAEVRQGTRRDAVLYSVGANASHGLRRTNADKRRAVETLLGDEIWAKWSNVEIGKRTGTSEGFVRQIKLTSYIRSDERTYLTKHGSIATMNTANIGQQQILTREQFLDEVFPGFHPEPRIVRPLNSLDDIFPGISEFEEQGAPVPESWKLPQEMRGAPAKSATLSALQSSESNEWYTPAQYVEAARELMGGIDLDPASNDIANQVVQATLYYDVNMNGLVQEWRDRVWLNPPYGFTEGKSNQEVWTHRLIEQFKAGITTEAVLLVNANTEAKWFQPLYDYLICFTNHRIRFYNADGNSSQPTQGNALIYFGKQSSQFIALFSQFGRIVSEVHAHEC